ncbi:MAG: protein kinase, partial [Nannocystaceae bacterium]|nr:protein kinase [Nannocystaceae bacterium]
MSGDRIANFEIERTLGTGAMGVVLLARDSDLGRHVVIKLLAPHYGNAEHAQRRLLREAQSVAQLQHPNVVALYQVGIHEDRVFLVMEYVDGGTLRQWIRATQRSWREIVAVYRQAGQGLSAAHDAGLVHRDFKPDNVLIGSDGRVRVSDFGLVGGQASGEFVPSATTQDVRLTQTGTVLGTPAYMAPEQFSGTRVDAAADQFALCVALFEALFGRRPFAGDNPGALLFCIESQELEALPRGHKVPSKIIKALYRGLSAAPARRHPSVAELVRQLDVAPAGPKTRRLVVGGALGAAALAATFMATRTTLPPETVSVAASCLDPAEPVPGWSDQQQAALASALRALDTPRAEAVAAGTVAAANSLALALSAARHEACVAAPDTITPRRACVEERLVEFAATVELLTDHAPRDVLLSSAALLNDLAPVELCDDPRNLDNRVPMDTASAPTRAVAHTLSQARTWGSAGHVDRAAALATEALAALPNSEPSPWIADAKLVIAALPTSQGKFTAAEGHIRAALAAARAVGDRSREARALGDLIFVLASDHRDAAALALSVQAQDAASNAGPNAQWRVQLRLAYAHKLARRYAEADASASLAVDILRASPTLRPRVTADAHQLRAGALVALERLPEACKQYEAALDAIVSYGPNHPFRAEILTAFARALAHRSDVTAARQRHKEAIEILSANPKDNRVRLGNAYVLLADLERTNNHFDAAAAALGQSVALWGQDPDTEEQLARSLIEVGIVEFMRGRNSAASDALSQAREIATRYPGSPLIELVRLEGMAGGVAVALGNLEEGLAHHRAKLGHEEQRYGPSTLQVARTHTTVGDIAMYLRRCDEARASYRRALRIRADLGLPRDDEVVRISAGQAVCDAIDGDLGDARDGLHRLEREVASGTTAPWRGGRLS